MATILREAALFVVAAALLATAGQAQAQDLKALEKELRTDLKGKVLTLKAFDSRNWLRFDAEGRLLDPGEPGPWTLYSKLEVTDVRLRGQKIQIHGNRIFVRFDDNKDMLHLRAKERVTVEVEFDSLDDVRAGSTLKKLFLAQGENLADYVPAYWRSFLAPETVPPRKSLGERAEELLQQHPERVRVTSGVAEAKNITRVPPRYPDVARRGRIGGTVVLDTIIGTDGSMKEIRIKQAAGMGLDEAAVEAVEQWKYSPTMLQGVPVEVETVITIQFKLY